MIIPPVAQIEAALEALTSGDDRLIARELAEFRGLGLRLDRLSMRHAVTDLERGYLLGLHTARIVIASMPAAILADVTL